MPKVGLHSIWHSCPRDDCCMKGGKEGRGKGRIDEGREEEGKKNDFVVRNWEKLPLGDPI